MSTTRTEDAMRWGQPAAELVERAHERQLALRFEVSALEAAVAAGREGTMEQYAYALEWLSRYAAKRVMSLSKDAARAHEAAGLAAPVPSPSPQGAAGLPHAPPPPPPPPMGIGITEKGTPSPCSTCGGRREHVLGCPEMDAAR